MNFKFQDQPSLSKQAQEDITNLMNLKRQNNEVQSKFDLLERQLSQDRSKIENDIEALEIMKQELGNKTIRKLEIQKNLDDIKKHLQLLWNNTDLEWAEFLNQMRNGTKIEDILVVENKISEIVKNASQIKGILEVENKTSETDWEPPENMHFLLEEYNDFYKVRKEMKLIIYYQSNGHKSSEKAKTQIKLQKEKADQEESRLYGENGVKEDTEKQTKFYLEEEQRVRIKVIDQETADFHKDTVKYVTDNKSKEVSNFFNDLINFY